MQTLIEFSNRYDLLPKEIQRFTMADNDTEDISEEMLKGAPRGAHHGAHPHLCHEFVSSIIEQRKCFVDEDMAANITAAGVCAHISAINSGKAVDVPEF